MLAWLKEEEWEKQDKGGLVNCWRGSGEVVGRVDSTIIQEAQFL